jgi:hypothetical protein
MTNRLAEPAADGSVKETLGELERRLASRTSRSERLQEQVTELRGELELINERFQGPTVSAAPANMRHLL